MLCLKCEQDTQQHTKQFIILIPEVKRNYSSKELPDYIML